MTRDVHVGSGLGALENEGRSVGDGGSPTPTTLLLSSSAVSTQLRFEKMLLLSKPWTFPGEI